MVSLVMSTWPGTPPPPCGRAPRPTPGHSMAAVFQAFQLRVGLLGALPCLHYSCMEPSLPGPLALCVSKEGLHAILFSYHRLVPVPAYPGAVFSGREFA